MLWSVLSNTYLVDSHICKEGGILLLKKISMETLSLNIHDKITINLTIIFKGLGFVDWPNDLISHFRGFLEITIKKVFFV